MKKHLLFLVFVLFCGGVVLITASDLFSQTSRAAKPGWVKNYGRSEKHPVHIYVVGFGIANGSGEEATQTAKDNARAEVSRQIVVNIQSIIRTSESENKGVISEAYSGITQSATVLQLQGVEMESYVEPNPSRPATYALAYVGRAELKRIYTQRASELRGQLQRILADAHTAEKANKITQAIKKYLSTYPLYAALKEAETILLVVRNSGSPSEQAFAELAEATRNLLVTLKMYSQCPTRKLSIVLSNSYQRLSLLLTTSPVRLCTNFLSR